MTELLAQKKVEASAAVDRALQETAHGSGKGPEERDRILGRLFVCASVIRSGVVDGHGTELKRLFDAIIEVRQKKKWIRQAATEVALSAAEVAPTELLLETIIPLLSSFLTDDSKGTITYDKKDLRIAVSALDGLSDFSPDQLQLALGLHQLMKRRNLLPYDGDIVVLPPCLNHPESVISKGVVRSLEECIRKSSSTFPRVHLMWPKIWDDLGLVMPRKSKKLQSKALKSVLELWNCCVGEVLTEGSHNQKGYALLLARDAVQRLPPQKELVEGILSPSIVRVLLNHASNPQSVLNSLAKSFLIDLPQLLCGGSVDGVKSDRDEDMCLYAIGSLINHGGIRFDNRSGTRVIANLLKTLSQERLEAHAHFLSNVIEDEVKAYNEKMVDGDLDNDVTTKSIDVEAAEALYILSRTACAVVAKGDTVLDNQMKNRRHWMWFGVLSSVFVRWGLMTGGSNALADTCKQKLFAIVANARQLPEGWGDMTSLGALYKAISHWIYLESPKGGGVKLRLEMREETRDFIEKVLHFVSPYVTEGVGETILTGSDKSQDEKLKMAFASMLMQLSLHILAGAHHLAQRAFDLFETYEMLLSPKLPVEKAEYEGGGDTDPVQVLIDILLSILGSFVDEEKGGGSGGTSSSRGLKDAIKGTWGRVLSTVPISEAAIRCLMSAVCAVDEESALGLESTKKASSATSDTSSENNYESNEEIEGDDTEHQDVESDENGGESIEGQSSDEEEGEDDVLLDAEGLQAILQEENKGEADALSVLIEARRKARGGKLGAADATNAQVRLQLHALDLLEIVLSRQRDTKFIYSLIQPIAAAARRLENQSNRSMYAQALRERLFSLLRKKLIKCKPPTCKGEIPDMGTTTEWFFLECGRKGLGGIGREAAREASLSCLKMTQHGEEDWERGKKAVIAALVGYMNRCRGAYAGIDGRVFTNIVTHLHDFNDKCCSSLVNDIVPALVDGLRAGKTLYLRTDATRLLRLLVIEEKKAKVGDSKSAAVGGEECWKVVTTDSLSALCYALKSVVKTHGGQGEEAVGGKAKHIRPMLQCAAVMLRNLIETKAAAISPCDLDHLLNIVTESAAIAQEAIDGAHAASLSSIGQEVIAQVAVLEKELAEWRQQAATITTEAEQSTKKKKRKVPQRGMDSGQTDKATVQKGKRKKKPKS